MRISRKASAASKQQPASARQRNPRPSASSPVVGLRPARATSKTLSSETAAPSKYKYKLRFHPEALKEWRALDNSVRTPLKKLLEKRLNNPRVPGGELRPPLAGCYKIKLKKAGVRLVYEIEDDTLYVYVLAVDKREDAAVYASARDRISALAAEIWVGHKKPSAP